jgi:hypothetical protein
MREFLSRDNTLALPLVSRKSSAFSFVKGQFALMPASGSRNPDGMHPKFLAQSQLLQV